MTLILDGKKLSTKLTPQLIKKIRPITNKPKLVIIQIADRKESSVYIDKKKSFGRSIGAVVVHKQYPETISEEEVVRDIAEFNADRTIHGIMVQLPIPKTLSRSRIIEAIAPEKDVDGLTGANTKKSFDRKETFLPAATQGMLTLLKHHKVKLEGKKIVIVGESLLVGRPTALTLLNQKATVTVCHAHTKKLEEETRRADILIVAAGKPGLITKDHVSANQIVIDVGTTVVSKNKVVGDVDFKNVKKIVSAITPVPGGVGPMTVYSLFENLVRAYTEQTRRKK